MVTDGLVRNVKHLEKETQIFNVICVIIVAYVKPIHSMCFRVLISNSAIIIPRRNQNWSDVASSTFWRYQTEVVVTINVLILQFIEIFNTIKTKIFQIFFDIVCCEVGNVTFL